MNIFLYIIIFIMGTLFGSFYTLAIYRLPRKIDITHTHSFCPNCNHKLGFWELIPVWSYLFLGGKCKECKQKIRPRYLIIEILSGLLFVLIALAERINAYELNVTILVETLFLVLYLVAIFIIAGIDKENRQIEKSVIIYALGIAVLYIIYLCIVDKANIYRYVMQLSWLTIIFAIDTIKLIKDEKNNYLMSILVLLGLMVIFTGEAISILTCIMTLLTIAIYTLICNLKNIKDKDKRNKLEISKNLRIGFYLCVSNVIILVSSMYIINM